MTPWESPIIVGRDRELAQLREVLRSLVVGRGQLVMIGGEAGIGKTVLVNQLAAEAVDEGVLVFTGHCFDLEATPLYGPWLDAGILTDAASQAQPVTTTPERQRILAFLQQHGPARPAQVAEGLNLTPNAATQALRRMLRSGLVSQPGYGLYAVDDAAVIPSQSGQTLGQSDRESQDPVERFLGRGPQALGGQVIDIVTTESAGEPALVILEDMHWSDQPSIELLSHVAHQLSHHAIMIALTYRDVELVEDQPLYHLLPHLARIDGAVSIGVRRLDQDAVRALIATRYGLAAEAETRLVEYLDRHAEGNPFFVEELIRSLDHDQILEESDNGWVLGALPEFQVPPIVQQIIDAQIRLLANEDRRLLQLAAVIGVNIPLGLWSAVAAVSEFELSGVVERATVARLLEETRDRTGLRFRHALIREALYYGVPLPRRRAWHRRVGELLAARPAADPAAVAHHFLQARDDRAAAWLIAAGRRAARAFAYAEAINYFEPALAILKRDERRLGERAWLLCEKAEAYRYIDTHQALQALNTVRGLCAQLDDPALEAIVLWSRARIRGFRGENTLEELQEAVAAYEALSPADRGHILQTPLRMVISEGTHAQWLAQHGLYREARTFAERFLAQSGFPHRLGDDNEHGNAYNGLGLTHAALGEPEQARAAFASARTHFRQAGNSHMFALSLELEIDTVLGVYYPDDQAERERLIEASLPAWQHTVLGPNAAFILTVSILDGNWEDARKSATVLLNVDAARMNSVRLLAELDRLQGQPAAAWSHVFEAIPEGPRAAPSRTPFPIMLDLQRIAAELALDADDLDTARCWIEAHERWLAWSGSVPGRATARLLWSRYQWRLGNVDAARQKAHEALDLAHAPRQPLVCLAAHRALGRLATHEGQLAEAECHLDQARSLAEACAAPYEVALCQLAQAELLLAMQRPAGAQPLFDAVRTVAAALNARPLLARLDDLEAQSHASPDNSAVPGGLSSRELEILRLVATGLTDVAIGEQLSISRRTVSGHLQSIYTKLGVNSRTAATAFAYERDLV